MYEYYCLNPISAVGLDKFPAKYENTECMQEADAILVRSADMHQLFFLLFQEGNRYQLQ